VACLSRGGESAETTGEENHSVRKKNQKRMGTKHGQWFTFAERSERGEGIEPKFRIYKRRRTTLEVTGPINRWKLKGRNWKARNDWI